MQEQRVVKGLGWFSLGLGLAEVAAPGRVAELVGMKSDGATRNRLRLYGMRELAAGVGILTQSRPAGWMWGRVAGDVMDLAYLASTRNSNHRNSGRTVAATAAVLGVTALDIYYARQLSDNGAQGSSSRDSEVHVVKTTTINKPPETVYQFWRDLENLPRFMSHLESVQSTGDGRSHWKAKAPAGRTVEWDAEITEDQPDARIAWKSLEGSDVENRGMVTFERAPGNRGTILRVELNYTPPGGSFASYIAKLFGEEPGQQIEDDLRRLKQILEIGDIVRSDASIHRGMHPARPSDQPLPSFT
ncbi:MAG TPA: SRPBCC family protein [Bryobacteraceae bacterium]|nr:SRPBCC family protein [Bryobacteraceae bacterium]